MNSFKKSHSRFLTIVLVLLLLVSMLAGCKKTDTPPEDNQSLPAPNTDLLENPTTPSEDPTEPSTAPLADNIAVVIADQLTVRSGPSADKNPIGTLTKGTHVEILRTENINEAEWALIREGWIPMEFVEMANESNIQSDPQDPAEETKPVETVPQEQPGATISVKGVITGDVVNIRSEGSTKGQIKGTYVKGDTVTVLETKDGWGRTSKGWISMQYVKTENGTDTNTNGNQNTQEKDNTTNTTDGTAYFITASELNIRSTASTNGNINGQYKAGDRIVISEIKDGWGKTDKGWISMTYAYKAGTKGNNGCNGVVIGDTLNVRSGPGTGYNGVGSFNYGTRVNILQRITIGNTTWGCTEKGWISMDYVYVDGTQGEKSGDGTIIGDQLNIRSGPGTGYGSVGSLKKGDTVKILEQIKVGDMTWGCIDKGWISMDYVTMG